MSSICDDRLLANRIADATKAISRISATTPSPMVASHLQNHRGTGCTGQPPQQPAQGPDRARPCLQPAAQRWRSRVVGSDEPPSASRSPQIQVPEGAQRAGVVAFAERQRGDEAPALRGAGGRNPATPVVEDGKIG